MNTNGGLKVVARTNRRVLILAVLLGMVLSATETSNAQSSATQVPATASVAKPKAAMPEKAPAASVASPVAEAPPKKAASEGIKVHGHWTVEVRNPDGTVASRQEFENALDPIEGADLLTGLLSGEYTTAGFIIDLHSSNGIICGGVDCLLEDSRTPTLCSPAFAKDGLCNAGLSYTPNTGTANNNAIGFTLSGSIQMRSTDAGTINTVSTGIVGCVPPASQLRVATNTATLATNAAATTSFVQSPPGQYQAGSNCADNNGGVEGINMAFTSTNITQTVGAGQSVAVTVVITFGS
jgi:hypothetical protein